MKQRRARPFFRFRPFSHASSRRLSRKRIGSIEKAVLSPFTAPLAGGQEAVLSPPTGPLATGPLAGAQEAVLSPPTGPLAGRHLLTVICFATASHNLIRDQKLPDRGPPRTPPGTQEALLSPPTGPLATGPLAGAQEAVLSPPTGPLAGRHLLPVICFATAFDNLIRDQKSP